MNTSSTFPLQIGMVYPSLRSQSTLCRTVMPAKYITLPFSLCFRTLSKFKPQKLVQQALVENGNVGTRKVKPTQKAIKTAAKHIYSKLNGHFQKIFDISFAEAQTKVSAELELQQKKSKIRKKWECPQRACQEKHKVQQEWSK